MEIKTEDLTLGQIKEIAKIARALGVAPSLSEDPYVEFLGEAIFVRTVTHHYTGKLVAVCPQDLVLEDVAWIADDGRFHSALETGKLAEVEPFPDGKRILNRGALLDTGLWPHPLPRAAV